jgi:ribosomal protein L3 glutamine methyltransferase
MHERTLLATLQSSDDNEAWVEAIARWFDAHELHFGHGTDNASDEAWWLLRHLQHWDDGLWQAPADPGLAVEAVRLALARTRSRKPLAYLIGEAWFCGMRFFVNEHVLVPRSPIAEIIERRFAPWVRLAPGDRILDVGTGSGCLAIAAAVACPDVLVDATDTSRAALDVAAANVEMHDVGGRVCLHRADLFPGERHAYRVIISNPPYVPEAQYGQLPAEYLHEPRLGLVGGMTGLEPAWAILRGAAERLTEDGVVVLEVGNEAEQLEAAAPGLAPVWAEFERGGEGVCIVHGETLREYLRNFELPHKA